MSPGVFIPPKGQAPRSEAMLLWSSGHVLRTTTHNRTFPSACGWVDKGWLVFFWGNISLFVTTAWTSHQWANRVSAKCANFPAAGHQCVSVQRQREGMKSHDCVLWPACFDSLRFPLPRKKAGIQGTPVKTAANLHTSQHAWRQIPHSNTHTHTDTHFSVKQTGWRDSWGKAVLDLIVYFFANMAAQCVCLFVCVSSYSSLFRRFWSESFLAMCVCLKR